MTGAVPPRHRLPFQNFTSLCKGKGFYRRKTVCSQPPRSRWYFLIVDLGASQPTKIPALNILPSERFDFCSPESTKTKIPLSPKRISDIPPEIFGKIFGLLDVLKIPEIGPYRLVSREWLRLINTLPLHVDFTKWPLEFDLLVQAAPCERL